METTPEPVSRPEHDAKLQAVEARLDAKIDRTDAKIDRIAEKLDALTLTVKEFMVETRESARSLRWWIAGMIATVILSISANFVINTWSIVQSVTAVYETGRNAAPRP